MDVRPLFDRTADEVGALITTRSEGLTATLSYPLEGRHQHVDLAIVTKVLEPHGGVRKMIHARSLVGPTNSAVDTEYLLECARELVMARITVLDDRERHIALEGMIPLDQATPEWLGALVSELAIRSDRLEHDLFEVDIH